jgi:hypothetical protein
MSNERLMMTGKLAELRSKRTKLQIKGKGLCRSIRPLINPAMLEVEEMEIPMAAQLMDEMVMVQGELLGTNDQIRNLEKALGQ